MSRPTFSIVPPTHPPPAPSYTHLSHVPLATPGATIPTEDLSVRARGTLLSSTSTSRVLTSTVAGVVSRVNKLVLVRALRSRYVPETGDVVVGRITEVAGRRWRVEIGAARRAVLLLSAVNMLGGGQRRRTQEDERRMREWLTEGDLISAEVQEMWEDGSVALHMRSERYGKLEGGLVVKVQSELVKRAKRHFHDMEGGIRCILGNNGEIFVGGGQGKDGRERVARISNCVRVLDMEFVAIGPDTISEVYQSAVENGVKLKDMTRPDVAKIICASARAMRSKA